MSKKILIGIIIAITVLIGVSFTSVTGYNSVEPNLTDSPLFNIRSSRAIDEDDEDLSCEYVGKGAIIYLLFSRRDDKLERVKNIIDCIIKMDDKTYKRFIASLDIENEEIVTGLNELRTNIDVKDIQIENWEKPNWYTYDDCTIRDYKPGCFLFKLLDTIAKLIILIVFWTFFPHPICY